VVFLPELRTADPGLQAAAREVAARATAFAEALGDVDDELARLTPGSPFEAAVQAWRFACRTVVEELIGLLEAMGVDTDYVRRRFGGGPRVAAA
jgi:hypothetical protein